MQDVKVRFDLEILEDGFPPVGSETLNGQLVGENEVKLDNTPFFAESVASGDILGCRQVSSGVFQYENVIAPSGNKAISIIFVDDGCKESVYQYLKGCGCYCEYGEFDGFNMLALSVDKGMDFEKIITYLDKQESLGVISYAELCV